MTLKKLVDWQTAGRNDWIAKLAGHSNMLCTVDRSIVLEQGVLEAIGGRQGHLLLEKSLLGAMPSASNPRSIGESVTSVKALLGGSMPRLLGDFALEGISSVLELLDGLSRGIAPGPSCNSSIFLKLHTTLQYFVQYTEVKIDSAGKDMSVISFGAEALIKKFNVIKKMKQIPLEKLRELSAYVYLMDGETESEFKGLVAKSVSMVKSEPKVLKTAKSSKAASSSADVDSAVLAFFK
jgi:hypothetical protein